MSGSDGSRSLIGPALTATASGSGFDVAVDVDAGNGVGVSRLPRTLPGGLSGRAKPLGLASARSGASLRGSRIGGAGVGCV